MILMIYETESLTSFLCNDIIENIEDEINQLESEQISLIIPKNNDKWRSIEKEIYKELLIHLNNYKNSLILKNTEESNNLIKLLSNDLYTRYFTINKGSREHNGNNKFKTCNRFNVISYLFCLSDSDIIINNISYHAEKGKLFLFPEEYIIKSSELFIYGQLCYENV